MMYVVLKETTRPLSYMKERQNKLFKTTPLSVTVALRLDNFKDPV